MQPLLLIDLDRTLFDTNAFVYAAWEQLCQRYGLDIAPILAEVPNFYVAKNGQAPYDFRAHVLRRVGDVPDALSIIRVALAGRDFAFHDVQAVCGFRPARILTCGDTWFQDFKLSFAPSLTGLSAEIILEPKAQFIDRVYNGHAGWLIDDKPNQHLPNGFTEITLDRMQPAACRQISESVFVVNSLIAASEVVALGQLPSQVSHGFMPLNSW